MIKKCQNREKNSRSDNDARVGLRWDAEAREERSARCTRAERDGGHYDSFNLDGRMDRVAMV
jgi:hypothetical protein